MLVLVQILFHSLCRVFGSSKEDFKEDTGDGALHHAVPSKGNTIGSMPIAIGIPWIRQAGYDTYLRGIKSRSGAEDQ